MIERISEACEMEDENITFLRGQQALFFEMSNIFKKSNIIYLYTRERAFFTKSFIQYSIAKRLIIGQPEIRKVNSLEIFFEDQWDKLNYTSIIWSKREDNISNSHLDDNSEFIKGNFFLYC